MLVLLLRPKLLPITRLENEASWTKEIEDYGCTVVDLTDAQREVFREAVAPEWDAVQERVSTDVWDAYVD